MGLLLSIFIFLIATETRGQKKDKAFIKLVEPQKASTSTSEKSFFIIGSTCKGCTMEINNETVKVYPTGAFAYETKFAPGVNEVNIVAKDVQERTTDKKLRFVYTPIKPELPTSETVIESVQTVPSGDVWVMPGDEINFRVKAKTGCTVTTINNTLLHELPDSLTKGMKGIYQGFYTVKETDKFNEQSLPVMLTAPDSSSFLYQTKNKFTVLDPMNKMMVVTKGRLAHLEYGWGDDRLGGAKIGYIDSLIPLEVIGKIESEYKVRLTENRSAYIPIEHVSPLPAGIFRSRSLTGKIRAIPDSSSDLVQIQLFKKLPYQSFQRTEPSQIVIDIFGATNNTNWIDQPNALKAIKGVHYEQIADEHFRVIINLKQKQHWGHTLYYEGNNLVVRVRHQPDSITLTGMRIALDAGHGGSNPGAVGALGIAEKTITLEMIKKLKLELENQGAIVVLTRDKDTFFDNKQRILFYRDSLPDLLISFHLNSSANPFTGKGTSVFYRHEGFRSFGNSIYKRMLGLGLADYGNNGSFNFMLNSPTEYPNALIEALFLSNPEEEMLMVDEKFQEKMAKEIVEGIKDFLKGCE